jgi:hypothetical protein
MEALETLTTLQTEHTRDLSELLPGLLEIACHQIEVCKAGLVMLYPGLTPQSDEPVDTESFFLRYSQPESFRGICKHTKKRDGSFTPWNGVPGGEFGAWIAGDYLRHVVVTNNLLQHLQQAGRESPDVTRLLELQQVHMQRIAPIILPLLTEARSRLSVAQSTMLYPRLSPMDLTLGEWLSMSAVCNEKGACCTLGEYVSSFQHQYLKAAIVASNLGAALRE